MFYSIVSEKDIKNFLDKTNSLHDGYIIDVHYVNDGITIKEDAYYFDSERTKLILRILVTSINDIVVEIVFENILEWQIKDNQRDILDTAVIFDVNHRIIWTDETFIDMNELKNNSYVIAQSMKWRIIE